MKIAKERTDKTDEFLKRARSYVKVKDKSTHVYNLRKQFVTEGFSLEFKKVSGVEKWSFKADSKVAKGELSASRVASVIINYRNALKTLGAINKDFKKSLEKAKDLLISYGVEESLVDGLKHNIKTDTLVDRLSEIRKQYNKGSVKSNSDYIRATIDSVSIYHPTYYKLSSPLSYVKSISNAKNAEALKAKHDKKIKINTNFIYNKAREVLNNSKSDWVDLTISLVALTGRRPTEIMKTANFKLCKEKENYLIFNGILKSRDRNLDIDFGEWSIPVLTDPELIIQSLKTMRRKLTTQEKSQEAAGAKGGYFSGGFLRYYNEQGKEVTASISDKKYINDINHNKAINAQYNQVLNERLRKWLSSGDIEMKSLRAIYTKSIWEQEKSTSPETYESMTTRILCYSNKTISDAVKHYAALEIDNTIESVQVMSSGDSAPLGAELLISELNSFDEIIKVKSIKAKKLAIIHEWTKARTNNGMTKDDLTVSYIRKNCKIGGRSINADTAGLYMVLINMVKSLETQTMSYDKDQDGNWLVTSKATNTQRRLID